MKLDNTATLIKEEEPTMKTEYDFSHAVGNPYAQRLHRQITLNLDADVWAYFQQQAELASIPCQDYLNWCLADCAERRQTPALSAK
ncbi:hypothetical protein AGMMS49959_01380 [Planctomycetales bacterium]|nr:hypothetical protein AGMMS49959_01380 [Planctomycetales bacterium]